ncbi:hypothetical protein CsSME_00012979 [Camellia sinensis var. sinensis]
MSDQSKVRLVRCPKCENLLPELADYSVYQCGGCGAVLRAKNKNVEADTLSEKSEEERVEGVSVKFSEKSDNLKFSEKGMMDLSDGSENGVKSSGISSRRTHKRMVLSNDLEVNEKIDESSNAEMSKQFEESKPPNGIAFRSRRSERVSDWRSGEGGGSEGFWRNPRRDVEAGPSNYHFRSSYGYGEPVKYQNKPDEFNKVEYLEQDRAELLRKLDELKDQISRSCDVNNKPKEKVPLNRGSVHQDKLPGESYGGSETWFPDGSWGSTRASYPSHYPEPSPYMNRHEMDMHRFYHSTNGADQLQRFGDPLRSQMLRRAPHQLPDPFQHPPSHTYFSRNYMNMGMDPYEPYMSNMNLHNPSCSCFHCYNKHPPQDPGQVPCDAFRSKMFSDVPNKPMFYHHENPSAFANPPPLNSNNPQSHTRWPNDLNSELGGFGRRHPPKVVLATGGRQCRPIAGGAPFVTCYNCFELLQLPKKIVLTEKNQKKVRCGACSAVAFFAVVNKKLVVSVCGETKRTPKMDDDRPNMTVSGGTSHFSSDDYDKSGYDFQSVDREVILSSTGKSEEMRSHHSTSPYSSEDEDSPGSLNVRGEESKSTELAAIPITSPPAAGSPVQDHFDYANIFNGVKRFGKGNQSGRSECEKGEPKVSTARQNSMKDASLATEIDVSFNEYSNTVTSQESGDASRVEDQLRAGKGGQSFFAGIMKRGFRDFSRSNQNIEQGATNVTINGHSISDRLLKKAEKLAGPIHPGQYWYDFRAGFWGVMGGPCLGIIPPFIEEFNYPMPENCAGGNTSVFVNGRELHQQDLRLLSSRGLPTTKDGSYIVEICGKVVDEDSGEELDSLGKLAPTVEKVKRGFGMKVPRVAA